MSGIYIHIPFCKQKCHYCNFYSFVSRRFRGDFVGALIKEIDQRQDYLEDKSVNTIYFGGGTPSMLSTAEINQIADKISDVFEVHANAEITLEANPDDIDEEKLAALKNDTSINRLSLGIQSFFDDDLTYLNRVHRSSEARKAIELSIKHGFQNMTIDLIYGIPTLTDEKWKNNLEIFFSYQLPHLSSYALTVEPKTALSVLINKGKMKNVDEEQSIRHFKILLEETEKYAYEHYEISNFAKGGFYSKHNSIYWLGGHYLGLGPSAHSFNGISRQWNVSNMKQYINSATVENIVAEKEVLTKEQQFNEYVMTSLRTSWGCDLEHIENVFGRDFAASFEQNMKFFMNDKKVQKLGNKYFLTNKGKLFADRIAAELFR